MSKKVADVVGIIVQKLESLTSEERLRAVNAALTVLGETAGLGAYRSPADAGRRQDAVEEESGDAGALSTQSRRWMTKSGVTRAQLDEVFHVEDGKIRLILGEAIGKSAREQVGNTYVLTGLAAFLETGSAEFADDVARENCEHLGCYDHTNHAKYIKSFGNKITGTKKGGWKLTAPGLGAAAAIVKLATQEKE